MNLACFRRPATQACYVSAEKQGACLVARRALPLMFATLAFFWTTIAARLKSLNCGNLPEVDE